MAKFLGFVIVLTLGLVAQLTNGHTYHTGSCPSVSPVSEFQMKDFLGIWYAIEKTSTASTCIVYNITRGEEPGEYLIQQLSQHFALGLTPLKHEYSYTGKLSVPDPDIPGKMRVNFPLSIAGSSSFTVFMTDYTQYGAIFSCQRLTFAHRRSATLLSRTRTLDKIYLDKMRSRLASFSVDPFDLSIVNQTGCPKIEQENKGFNINIDPETFSAHNIGSAVKKAGEKIGDGVEYAIDATKKVYNKYAHDGGDSGVKVQDSERYRIVKSGNDENNKDAEWIPF